MPQLGRPHPLRPHYFFDNKHGLAELACHGATELDPEQVCTNVVIQALAAWHDRPNHQLSGSDLLRIGGCTQFSINHNGIARGYWPNESENDTSETLNREFLYHNGTGTIADERVRLFHARYTIMALTGDEYLLVCPYLTATGNVSEIVVVTVT